MVPSAISGESIQSTVDTKAPVSTHLSRNRAITGTKKDRGTAPYLYLFRKGQNHALLVVADGTLSYEQKCSVGSTLTKSLGEEYMNPCPPKLIVLEHFFLDILSPRFLLLWC